MNLNEMLQQQGLGAMATASKDGCVNTAVYGRTHVIDEQTTVWGMTGGWNYRNISDNPQASFLFKASGPGLSGVRLALELVRTEGSGPMPAGIKENADATVGTGIGTAVTQAAWFTFTEVCHLI